MMMHLLIRGKKDGILCPIPSHSLYTDSMVLRGATLVCTTLTRQKQISIDTNYCLEPI